MGKKNEVATTEQTEICLADFIFPQKVIAFCNEYIPIDRWVDGCEVFTDYQLRSYFKAVVCPLGDPLIVYLQELEQQGFKMRNDECGEPVIYAMAK